MRPTPGASGERPLPNYAEVHAERLRPGVTLALLHYEYQQQNPGGYGYTQFCEYYGRWLDRRGLTMRQDHLAGDKMFVDYSGRKPAIVDLKTGERIEVELFVAVLGASNHTYAEATYTQRVADFVVRSIGGYAIDVGSRRHNLTHWPVGKTDNTGNHPVLMFLDQADMRAVSARGE